MSSKALSCHHCGALDVDKMEQLPVVIFDIIKPSLYGQIQKAVITGIIAASIIGAILFFVLSGGLSG